MTTNSTDPSAQLDTRPIIVGYDGSAASSSALDRGIMMARALAVPLRIVAAWQYPLAYGQYPMVEWSLEEDTQALVDGAVRSRFGAEVPTWVTAEALEGSAAKVLIRESGDAQMLVVGSRGHGGFLGLLLGSVSSACAEHAGCPVLVMHTPVTEWEDPISAGSEALGDGSRASDGLLEETTA